MVDDSPTASTWIINPDIFIYAYLMGGGVFVVNWGGLAAV
jgi:hypothetical protein